MTHDALAEPEIWDDVDRAERRALRERVDAGIYFSVAVNPVAFWATFLSAGPSGNYDRLLLVEADSSDVTVTGGAAQLWVTNGADSQQKPVTPGDYAGDWVYEVGLPVADSPPVPDDDRPLSRLFHAASTITVVAETTLTDKGQLATLDRRKNVAAVAAILAGYGWTGWTPARV